MSVSVRTNEGFTTIPTGTVTRTGTANEAIAIRNNDLVIQLNSTTGAKAITMTSTFAGHRITLATTTSSGGSYTAAISGGTLTLDALNEVAGIYFDGTTWRRAWLNGATIV